MVSAPPRPATLREEGLEVPVPPSAPTRPDASVAAIDPLRVTILAPTRGDQKVADEIAQTVQNEGHELVRVQSFDFNVSSRNLRYFHPEDRAAAAELAARYDADAFDKAEALLDELRPESPLRHRLSVELEEIRKKRLAESN